MPFGKSGNTYAEMLSMGLADKTAQFAAIAKIVVGRLPMGIVFRRITAQGQDVADAPRLDIFNDDADVLFRMQDPGQVGESRDMMLLFNMLDDLKCPFAEI